MSFIEKKEKKLTNPNRPTRGPMHLTLAGRRPCSLSPSRQPPFLLSLLLFSLSHALPSPSSAAHRTRPLSSPRAPSATTRPRAAPTCHPRQAPDQRPEPRLPLHPTRASCPAPGWPSRARSRQKHRARPKHRARALGNRRPCRPFLHCVIGVHRFCFLYSLPPFKLCECH